MNMKKIAIFLAFIITLTLVPGVVSAESETIASAEFKKRLATTSNMTASLLVHQPTVETQGDLKGWRLDSATASLATICCNITDSVLYNASPETTLEIDVTYYNDSYGGFMLYYDAEDGKKEWDFVQMTPTNTWETHTFTLYNPRFANGISGSYDFQILASDANITSDEQSFMGTSPFDVLISSVTVRKLSTISPYKITAETGKPGNIFLERDPVKFDVTVEDLSGSYPASSYTYTVKTYDGKDVISGSAAVSNGKSTLTLTDIPYGVYLLYISPNGNNIEQTQVIDFSRSRTADEINMRFGTNIHFNWDIYSKEDIKAIADLAKNAGYGFSRTTHGWMEIETRDNLGNYVIPEKLMYANKYLDEIGLEMLAILSCGHWDYDAYPYWLEEQSAREAYGKFCYATANAIKEYTDYFTAPNEFNLTTGGTHNPDNYPYYVEATKTMYENVTAAYPEAFVCAGAVGRYEEEWIENCYKNGILNYCDAFSMHVYDTLGGPETWYIFPTMQQHHDLLEKYDSSKQAWITENGWSTREVSFAPQTANAVTTEPNQAKWYPRSLAINSNPNRIDKYFHYAFVNNGCAQFEYEHNFGILRSHNYRTPFAAKPAYITTCAFNDIIGNATFVGDVDSADDYYAYKYKTEKDEDVYCIWKEDGRAGATFTVESNKPYFEVYDMNGNMTVVENTAGSYSITQGENPSYIKCVNEIAKEGQIILENTANSVWLLEDENSINIKVEMPTESASGDNVAVIMAAYDKNGALVASEVQEFVYGGTNIETSFLTENLPEYDNAKFFVFDGVSAIRPIMKSKSVSYFGDDEKVSASIVDGVITVSGVLKDNAPNKTCIVTAFNEDTQKQLITAGTYADYILYQDVGASNANGAYSFTFELPESYEGESVCVQISSEKFATQKTIYLK